MSPWLSVILPTYNGARFLGAALESVRGELTDGMEIVAVDDASTDATREILRSYESALPLRRLLSARTGNWVAGSNLGLREARGRYACFLHQDDLWLPGRIAAVRRELETAPALVVHPAIYVGPTGERLGRWRCPLPPHSPVEPRMFIARLLVQNFIAMPAPTFEREEALRAGGMDESLWYTADWDLWLRLGRVGPVRYIPSPLAAFRLHPGSQTAARPSDREDRLRQLRAVLDRHFSTWEGAGAEREQVRAAADLSVEVNVALAAAGRGERVGWGSLLRRFARLGPAGWRRYLRDSRLAERVTARLWMLRRGG